MMRLLVIVGCIALVSCERESKREEGTFRFNADGFTAGAARSADFTPTANTQAPVTVERKLIKNGSVDFEVSDIATAKKNITDMTAEAGGYISSDHQTNYGGAPRYELTIRIPAEKLDEFISKIESLARNVDSKNISVQDVTEEFIDVETRLKTKKELEARYLELLKQAKTVKDLIEVETQLANVRGEIESMEGRLKYLTNQVSFSTVNLNYYQPVSGNIGFGYRLSRTFGNGWDNFLSFIIGIFEAWPFVIIGGVLVWLFIRWYRRRRQVA